jgi:hypothetical protein
MSKDTIVTAIYHYSYQSRMGGRDYKFEHYENPFSNLLNLDMNIVIFSHSSEINKIEAFFKKNNFINFKIIDYDLNNYAFSDAIYDIKEKKGIINENGLSPNVSFVFNDRNTHLCLSKMDFLKEAINGNYFDSEKFYWVDAGLFHHGLFPYSIGGAERCLRPQNKDFWPLNENNICRPGLINNINNKNNNKNLLFMGLTNFSSPSWWTNISDVNKQAHIIGGIFGGNKLDVLKMHQRFDELVGKVFKLNELTLEEDILSIIVAENNYNYLDFSTWYHDISSDPCYYGVSSDQKSFYKIFLY